MKITEELNDEIGGYKLSLFAPSRYLKEEFKPLPLYQTHSDDPFSQADRETFLVGMMKVNFLKRLESSVESFEITRGRTIGKIEELELNIAIPEAEGEADDPMEVGGQDFSLDLLFFNRTLNCLVAFKPRRP